MPRAAILDLRHAGRQRIGQAHWIHHAHIQRGQHSRDSQVEEVHGHGMELQVLRAFLRPEFQRGARRVQPHPANGNPIGTRVRTVLANGDQQPGALPGFS